MGEVATKFWIDKTPRKGNAKSAINWNAKSKAKLQKISNAITAT